MPPSGRQQRAPRKATRRYLQNAAEHYLARFSTSAENLRRILMRKVHRSAMAHDTDPEEGAQAIEEIIARYQRLGLVDDDAYAEARVRGLRGRGASTRLIHARLREKGITADVAAAALARHHADDGAEDPEFQAAVRLARRRRLGPFAPAEARQERRDKDLAVLARAGFGYEIARRIVEAPEAEELLVECGLEA